MSANVGYATLQIIPSARGFGAALNGQVDPVTRDSGRKAGRNFSTAFMPGLKSIGAGLAAAYAGSKAIGFLKGAISEASDLNEAGTKLQQVFGSATGEVLNFAKGGAKALGQSNLAVQNSAALFGVYGRAAGLAGKANAEFSTNLVQLSTDLASFYNTNPADAAQAISAALRGENEPIRAYGVLLDQASVKNEALRQGLIKTTKDALTPQAKVLATQALILRQTSVAQGDFARTSGGLANQQRILAAQVENLKGRVGAALLPAAVAATHAMNGLLQGTGALAPVVGRVKSAVADFASHLDFSGVVENTRAVLGNLYAILQPLLMEAFRVTAGAVAGLVLAAQSLLAHLVPLTSFLRKHRTIVQAVAVAILAGVVAYKAFTTAQKVARAATAAYARAQAILNAVMAANPIMLAVIALAALAAGLVYAYKHSETFRRGVQQVGAALLGLVATGIRAFGSFLKFVLGVYDGILRGAAKGLGWIPGIGPKVKAASAAFSGMKDSILRAVDGAASAVDGLSTRLDNAARPRVAVIDVRTIQTSDKIGNRDALEEQTLRRRAIAAAQRAGTYVSVPQHAARKAISSASSAISHAASSAGAKAGKSAGKTAKEKFAEAFADVKTIVRRDLLKGLTGAAPEVLSTFRSLTAALKKAAKTASGEAKKEITKALRTIAAGDDRMVALAKKHDTISATLKRAQERLADLQKEAAEFRAAVTRAVIDSGNVTADGGEGGFAAIRKRMTDAVKRAREFAAALATLKKNGLNSESLRQIVEAGPEQGLAAANAILKGGQGAVAEVNALQGQLTKAAGSVASQATSALYKAGLDSAQGLVDGLKRQESAITAQMRRIARAMVAEIKRALGIKSPSRVMRGLGAFTMQGFQQGVEGGAGDVQNALRAATAPPSPRVPQGGVQGAASSAPTARLVAPVHLDGRVVAEAVFEIGGRDYDAGRKEF